MPDQGGESGMNMRYHPLQEAHMQRPLFSGLGRVVGATCPNVGGPPRALYPVSGASDARKHENLLSHLTGSNAPRYVEFVDDPKDSALAKLMHVGRQNTFCM